MADVDDYAWLAGPEAALWLERCRTAQTPLLKTLDSMRKELGVRRATLVSSQSELRRKGAAKFGVLAEKMLFEAALLEQASDLATARYVAATLARSAIDALEIDDYCCGLGGNLMAFAERAPAALAAWDHSDVALYLAQHNLGTVADAGAKFAEFVCRDVGDANPSAARRWHIDPGRRHAGRRSVDAAEHSPPADVWRQWLRTAPYGAIKLAPGYDPDLLGLQDVVCEWISRDRECRQLVIWGRAAVGYENSRVATRAPCVFTSPVCATNSAAEPTPRSGAAQFVGEPDVDVPPAAHLGSFLAEPDSAVVAARLSGALAESQGLNPLGPGAIYLTGDRQPDHPLLAVFEVETQLPLRIGPVADYLTANRLRCTEVKKRGVEIDPAQWLKRLPREGDDEASLIATRVGPRRLAIVARRITSSAD
ncbi:MAG: hypothetical protein KDA61_05430 [Planctomycetales bacterium]|nr:hypothetical protein [Planctomycetales bacterium]